MYQIRSESAKTIIDRKNIKLPRFQRKQTWDNKKNFMLCISIFHGFPIGSIVINDEPVSVGSTKTNSWLLDGRQRRNALRSILDNPENIYIWAKTYLGLKDSDSETQITDKYWQKVDEHLESDLDEDNNNNENNDENNENEENEENEETSNTSDNSNLDLVKEEIAATSYNKYDDGLQLLLEVVLMCHKKTKYSSGFTSLYNFSKYLDRLDYIKLNGTRSELDGKKITLLLKEFLLKMSDDDIDIFSEEDFFDFFNHKYILKPNKESSFKNEINRHWIKIKKSIEIVEQIELKIQETLIGIIELKSVRSSDAQNIFKLINSTGTDLTAVEILSAKPSWNVQINQPSNDLINSVNEIYSILDVKRDTENIVKWDFPATLIGRLVNLDFVFKPLNYKDDKQFKTRVTLGFKLLAALYANGITKEKVSSLARVSTFDWDSPDNIVNDLNLMGRYLREDSFFRYLKTWNTNLMSLTSDAIAINFTTLVYKNWVEKGKPFNGANFKKFRNEGIILFDRMIFEYTTRMWRGSSDSKVAENIKNFNVSSTFEPVPYEYWETLLNNVFDQEILNNSKITNHDVLKPLLYYSYFLQQIQGPNDINDKVEIDHIIPQTAFKVASGIDESRKNNLANLSLFIKRDNISKSDSSLEEILARANSNPSIAWVLDMIVRNTKIAIEDFNKFNTASDLDDLVNYRRSFFISAFSEKRNMFFNNNN